MDNKRLGYIECQQFVYGLMNEVDIINLATGINNRAKIIKN